MVIIGSDYSQQEPKVAAVLSADKALIKSFQEDKDIYATIAGLAFNQPYEKCLEFHPETHAYQPDGKEMRGSAKTIVLGILYGRSVKTIGDQLYGKDKSLSDDEKTKKAQRVYDSVLKAFPGLRDFMFKSQQMAHELGYVTTITGRRRHIPEMMLDDYDFKPLPGYVNPDVDPLDPSTLANSSQIPDRIIKSLKKEYAGYKYYGQIVKRNKELHEKYHIQVVNNTRKKSDASRECVNCVDVETEILTVNGWKHYYEINEGDKIYSYNTEQQCFQYDRINKIFIYEGKRAVYKIIHPQTGFCSICTSNHNWVVADDVGLAITLSAESIADENFSDTQWIPIFKETRSDIQVDIYDTDFDKAYLHELEISTIEVPLVWCVNTDNHTWIGRRAGGSTSSTIAFLTSNSSVQGSAADMTKMALVKVINNPRISEIGAKVILPVHDELILVAPEEYAEEAGEILSHDMQEAGSFLPFPIKCDVETSYRWYGLSYPCPYKRPESIHTTEPEEIKWIQYCLYEMEYLLPVYKDEKGEKPKGDAAKGVNGVISDEMMAAIEDYKTKWKVDDDHFIEDIWNRVDGYDIEQVKKYG